MKRAIIPVAALMFLIGAGFSSCTSSSDKVENAQEEVQQAKQDVQQAKEDLDKAKQEYMAEMESYKTDMEHRIDENEKRIAELRAQKAPEKKSAKEWYNEKIDQLEQKNKDLKRKLENYKEDGKDRWEGFKTEFNHDMDELGRAFKDLTVKNTH